MTPKEKAKELVNKFTVVGLQRRNEGIQCAIIAVDEMIKFLSDDPYYKDYKFFEEVKTELEKL